MSDNQIFRLTKCWDCRASMKFGKRVASEAARSSHQKHFLDYKACKRAIQQDVLANGVPPQQCMLLLNHGASHQLHLEGSCEAKEVSAAVQTPKASASGQSWRGNSRRSVPFFQAQEAAVEVGGLPSCLCSLSLCQHSCCLHAAFFKQE